MSKEELKKKRRASEEDLIIDKKKHKGHKEKKSKKDKKEKKSKKDKKGKVKESRNSLQTVEAKNEGNRAKDSISYYTQRKNLSDVSQKDIDTFYKEHEVNVEDPQNLKLSPVLSFSDLQLQPEILSEISKFPKPTPIQAISWPYLLSHRDVIGIAETGSGKTLAFGIPAIEELISSGARCSNRLRMLVISPTRELASQIHDNLVVLTKKTGLSCCCLYGGVSKQEQREEMKHSQIAVATPGRLLDLIGENSVELSQINYLVLDEADRMLEKGFEEDIKNIIKQANSKNRQTLMFTATWPREVRELASTFMNDPVKISVGNRDELCANKRITQIVEVIEPRQKEKKLLELLRKYQCATNKDDKVLIFALYKKEASRVENKLRYNGYNVVAIHGDLSQQQRTNALNDFKTGKSNLLLATDVAARGLDIPNVKTVINLTFPLTVEDYVHRIGRTGRAGRTGTAHTLFTENEKHLAGALINVLNGANQQVPEDLKKFGTHTKRKEHSAYGAFFRKVDMSKKPKKVTFD